MKTSESGKIPQSERMSSGLVWNILTVLALLGVVCATSLFLTIFMNPQSRFNPFPPPTLPIALALPTDAPTREIHLPATMTPTPVVIEEEVVATPIPERAEMTAPTSTAFPLVNDLPTLTPPSNDTTETTSNIAAKATDEKSWPFTVKGGKEVPIANIAHPDAGCDWMGVAGRVFDLKGAALQGQQVQLGGYLPGVFTSFEFMLTLTGLAPQYGPGYYEFTLSDHPIASKGTLWIQLLDQQGLPMSAKTYFDTYNACDKNMILLDFQQIR